MARITTKSIVLFTFCCGLYFSSLGQVKVCKELDGLQIESEVQLNNTSEGIYSVVLKFNDQSLSSYAIWMNGPDNDQRIYRNREKKFSDLKAGLYEFIIVDRKGCSKKIEVKVK